MDVVIAELRRRTTPVPSPLVLPTEDDVLQLEKELGLRFHHDLRRYLLEASDVVVGTKEPVTVHRGGHTDLARVLGDARESGVPVHLLPVCEDNGDYFCMSPTGEIVFWSHAGVAEERWPDLATWIHEVWLGGK